MARQGGERATNSYGREMHKLWLLGARADRFHGLAPFDGDGTVVSCSHCGLQLNYHTVERDRIDPHGPYRVENLQPSCRHCNASRGADVAWVGPNPQPWVNRPVIYRIPKSQRQEVAA